MRNPRLGRCGLASSLTALSGKVTETTM